MIFDFEDVEDVWEYRGLSIEMVSCTWEPAEKMDYVGFMVDGLFREIPAKDMHDVIAHLDAILDGPKVKA